MLPSLRAVGGLGSRGIAWDFGAGPIYTSLLSDRKIARCSVSQNVDAELGQASTFHARPRDTDYLRSSNLTERTLRSVEHTHSTFGHDPSPVRRGLLAAVTRCVRKPMSFSLFRQTLEHKRSQSLKLVLNTSKAKIRFVFCFPIA